MPGRGTPPGESYPECREAGKAGRARHKREGTVTCALCRARTTAEMAAYRKARIMHGNRMVPAVGTQRRIRALVVMGWSLRRQGARLGISGKALGDVFTYQQINRDYAARVAGLYRELMVVRGPDEREARAAQRAGWPGPLDWDDIDRQEDVVPGYVVERDHQEALEAHRAYRKMVAKRERRARMTEEERRSARAAQRLRRERARVVA